VRRSLSDCEGLVRYHNARAGASKRCLLYEETKLRKEEKSGPEAPLNTGGAKLSPLQAASAPESANGIKGNKNSNKRLALLGDAVIRLLILDEWYLCGSGIGKSFST
jgi:hypothetical protein